MKGDQKEAAAQILKGMELCGKKLSYLKDGFRILSRCGAYQELCTVYGTLGNELQQVSKLKLYYISALHELGQDARAYELLEENGGIEPEDIREGEKSLTKLWTEIHERLFGSGGQVPHKYNFRVD